jgi:hypothetical protein
MSGADQPTRDERAGMTWWNELTEAARREWMQRGAEGPSARKRTVAYCTQYGGEEVMPRYTRHERLSRRPMRVLHAMLSPALDPPFTACNTPALIETLRPTWIARHDCTQ